MSLSNDDVLAILALLDASQFDELRVEMPDFKLHLRRSASAADAAAPAAPAAPTAPAVPAPAPVALPPPAAIPTAVPTAAAPQSAAARRDGVDVTAPLLGTFYGAPQPGAPPFVTVGAVVDENTVVAIVEVMKLMNSVCAGANGVVIEILARDGQLVEYGQPLMRIGPPAP